MGNLCVRAVDNAKWSLLVSILFFLLGLGLAVHLGLAHTCMSYAFSIPLPFPGKHGCFSGRSRIPWIASCNSWLEILVCFFTSETVKKKRFCVLLVLLMFVVVERLYNRTGLGLQHHFFFLERTAPFYRSVTIKAWSCKRGGYLISFWNNPDLDSLSLLEHFKTSSGSYWCN